MPELGVSDAVGGHRPYRLGLDITPMSSYSTCSHHPFLGSVVSVIKHESSTMLDTFGNRVCVREATQCQGLAPGTACNLKPSKGYLSRLYLVLEVARLTLISLAMVSLSASLRLTALLVFVTSVRSWATTTYPPAATTTITISSGVYAVMSHKGTVG